MVTNRMYANMCVTAVGIAAVIVEADLLASPWRGGAIGPTIAVLCGITFGLGASDKSTE